MAYLTQGETLGGIRRLEIYSSLGVYKGRIRTKPTPEA